MVCEFKSKCDCYFDGSFTCQERKRDCYLYTQLSTGEIKDFKIEAVSTLERIICLEK